MSLCRSCQLVALILWRVSESFGELVTSGDSGSGCELLSDSWLVQIERHFSVTYFCEHVVPVWFLVETHLLLNVLGHYLEINSWHVLLFNIPTKKLSNLLVSEGLRNDLALYFKDLLLLKVQCMINLCLNMEALAFDILLNIE